MAVFLPNEGLGFWPFIGMGAIRCARPSRGIVFALELTHHSNVLLPLVVATLARHAYRLSGEYPVDPPSPTFPEFHGRAVPVMGPTARLRSLSSAPRPPSAKIVDCRPRRHRNIFMIEDTDDLRRAILIHTEVLFSQIGDKSPLAVEHGRVQNHQVPIYRYCRLPWR